MSKHFDRRFWDVVKWVRGVTLHQFRLRIVPGLRDGPHSAWGLASQGPKTKVWTISMDPRLPRTLDVYCLLEEISHVENFAEHGYVEDPIRQHRDSWARRYGWWIRECYKAFPDPKAEEST